MNELVCHAGPLGCQSELLQTIPNAYTAGKSVQAPILGNFARIFRK